MPRHFYIGLFTMVVVVGVNLSFYRTPILPAQVSSAAEFGGVSLTIEYATTESERERGLGGRESIPANYGMLFVFPKEDYYGFWMKDTLVPLDIFWLDAKGQVISIAQEVATSSYPHVFYPTAPARYVLETASGFAREHAVATSSPLRLKNLPTVSQ